MPAWVSLITTGAIALCTLVAPRWGLLAIVALYPLISVVPRSPIPGVNAETVLFAVGIASSAILARRFFPPSRVLVPMLFYYAAMAFGVVILLTWYDPETGWIPALHLARSFKVYLWPTLIFFMTYAWASDPAARQRLASALIVGVFLASLTGLAELRTSSAEAMRIAGVTENPNILGILIAAFSVISLERTLGRGYPLTTRLVFGAMHAVLLIALVITQSRKSWIAALLVHLVWLFYTNRKLLLPAVASTALAFTAAYPVLPEAIRQRIEETFQPDAVLYRTGLSIALDSSASTRVVFYRMGLEMFLESPLIGHGFEGFKLRSPRYGAKYGLLEPTDPHSLPLKILTENGLLGISAFLWVVWLVFRLGFELKRADPPDNRLAVQFLACCVGLALVNLAGTAMNTPIVAVPFWSFFGLVARGALERSAVAVEKGAESAGRPPIAPFDLRTGTVSTDVARH
jgi:O-antigen ligase